jgi:ornithine carbamoyltransferase
MKHLLSIAELSADDVEQIFQQARTLKNGTQPSFPNSTIAYSFEGNSLRTRATFLKAMVSLGATSIELPNLLKTKENMKNLAGYMDQWIDMYVIRESDHVAIETFAHASQHPVVNAMSAQEHPCEILSDAFYLQKRFGSLQGLKFCIVGRTTNVLRSWREFCELFKLEYILVMPEMEDGLEAARVTKSLPEGLRNANIILTDNWGGEVFDKSYQLTLNSLQFAARGALVIPCPPFDTNREVHQNVIESKYFVGYEQKRELYFVHKAILTCLLT